MDHSDDNNDEEADVSDPSNLSSNRRMKLRNYRPNWKSLVHRGKMLMRRSLTLENGFPTNKESMRKAEYLLRTLVDERKAAGYFLEPGNIGALFFTSMSDLHFHIQSTNMIRP